MKMRKATVKVMKRKPATPPEEGRIAELMREVLVELGERSGPGGACCALPANRKSPHNI